MPTANVAQQHHHHSVRHATRLVLAAAVALTLAQPASAATISYTGGSSWTGGGWTGLSPGVFPDNNPGDDIVIDSGGGTPFDVEVDAAQAGLQEYDLGTLTLGAADRLVFQNGRAIGVRNIGPGAAVQNDGVMLIDTGGFGFTGLRVRNGGTIAGSGELVMSGGGQSGGALLGDGTVITHSSSHTVRGYGDLLDDTAGMVNDGTVLAQNTSGLASPRHLRVDPDANGFVNNGVLAGDAGGFLRLDDGVFINNTVIEARDGSLVEIRGGAVIEGGSLAGTGSGLFELNDTPDDLGASTADPTLRGVTIESGTLAVIRNGNGTTIENGLTHHGTLQVGDSAGSASELVFEGGSQAVVGSGTIELLSASGSRVQMGSAGGQLTIGDGITIEGQGRLLHQTGNGINHGHVVANQNQGGLTRRIVIDPGPGGAFDNFGLMGADNSGTLQLRQGFFTNRGNGSIDVSDSGTLELSSGATLRNQGVIGGSGVIDTRNGLYEAAGGRIDPGASPGTLTWLGDFDQGGVDELFIEIAGLDQGVSYDLLDVSGGDAILDGFLTIDLLGFAPDASDVFEIVNVSDGVITGDPFAGITVLGGGSFDVLRTGSALSLTNFRAAPSAGVPAPATLALLAGGLLLFGRREGIPALRRRHR